MSNENESDPLRAGIPCAPLYPELRRLTGYTDRTLRRWQRDGLLPASFIAPGNVRMVRLDTLNAWAERAGLRQGDGQHGR